MDYRTMDKHNAEQLRRERPNANPFDLAAAVAMDLEPAVRSTYEQEFVNTWVSLACGKGK